MRKWSLFVPFKIVCRLHPWMARTHVRNPFVLPSPVGLFRFTDPRRMLGCMGGRFRGVTMDMLPNHSAYVCTGRRFLDNPATRDRIYTIFSLRSLLNLQPSAPALRTIGKCLHRTIVGWRRKLEAPSSNLVHPLCSILECRRSSTFHSDAQHPRRVS